MLLDRIFGLFSTDMGIDLGTANTLVYVAGRGVALFEPSVVAISKNTNRVLRVGSEAKEMLGKTPASIVAVRPLKDGVIADFDITEEMLKYFIDKVHNRRWGYRFYRPRIVIAIPKGITPVEKRAVYNSAERAGARDVYLVEEPKAAAIGCDLPVQEPIANMIVDIGGGTTEVAVISLGEVATHQSIRVAGDEMDEAIVVHLKKAYNMDIGPRMSENIKINIGSAYPLEQELTMIVKGRDCSSGLPRSETANSEEIRESLREPIDAIILAIRMTLETTQPELSADLVERGIVMAGGGSLLRGLDKVISKESGLPCQIADDPLAAVARGTGVVLEHLDDMRDVLESAEDEF